MAQLEVSHVTKSFDGRKVLEDVSIRLGEKELVALLGVSGGGKTTLFNVISGILKPDSGQVFLDGEEITGSPGKVSYMLQKDLLLPYRTIEDNVALPLIIKGEKKKAARSQVQPYFQEFGLEGTQKKYPAQLSGGMRQRAALLRTYMFSQKIALLDEPFSALDSYLKEELQFELKQHLREFGKTTIIVSHDRDEIYKLCDRTMVMGQGEILVSKDTKELFEQPERVIAARLTGCKNISRAKKCGMHKVYAMDWGVELTVDRKVSEKITHVGIRAHDFHPADASSHDSENKIPVAVDREVRAPFEWTILFRNRENPKENMWMKMEREQTQIPQWVQVDPKRILLLEE